MKNEYEIRGEITAIFLRRKDGTTLETIISTTMLEKAKSYVGTWYPSYSKGTQSFYARGHINGGTRKDRGKSIGLHRHLLDSPQGLVIDHINHDTLNNTDENMRICSHKVNMQNKNRLREDKTNQGINWKKDKNKWRVQHRISGKYHHVGYFVNYEDAVIANEMYLKQVI